MLMSMRAAWKRRQESKKRTNSNGSSKGIGVAVKDLKRHDVVDGGSLEVPLKYRRKQIQSAVLKEMVWS